MRRAVSLSVAFGLVAGALVAFATPAAAHAGGGDLPLPLWQFLYAAGAALVVSFLVLRVLWPEPRLTAASSGHPLPTWFGVAAGAAGIVLRVLGVVLWVLAIAAAWLGTENTLDNVAPYLVYVALWAGMQGLSALLGDAWRVLSPFDTIAAVAQWVRDRRWPGPAHELPDDGSLPGSHWPAALGVLGFLWLWLCYHSPTEPRVLAVVMTGYSIVMLGSAARYGRDWLRTGEAFAVLFGLFSLVAPFFRDVTGRLRIRAPFSGLATLRPRNGTIAFMCVLLGSTGFDGVEGTQWWQDVTGDAVGWDRTVVNTFGFVWIIGIVAAVYVAASMAAAYLSGTDRDEAPRRFVGALVPIAVGYAVAHYFSLVAIESQSVYANISDPFGEGWDLFGTATRPVDLAVVSATTIAWVQVIAIVAGHIAGVVVAHDITVEEAVDRDTTRSQYPLLLAVIASTLGGMALLVG